MIRRTSSLTAALAAIAIAIAAAPGRAASENLPDGVVRTTLPDGLRILCKTEPQTPIVSVQILVKVGSEEETDGTAGIGSLVARTLLASTTSRGPDTIAGEIRDLGDSVSVDRQPDWIQISALTVPDKMTDLLDLLTDVLKNATFDADVVDDQKNEMLSEIDAGEASPFDRTYTNMRSALFTGTGYGLPPLGTPRTVERLMRTQLLTYYYHYFIPTNMVVSIAGNVQPDQVASAIQQDMADYDPLVRGSARPEPVYSPIPQLADDVAPVRAYATDLSEVSVMVGYRAPSMAQKDYYALQIANALLGGMKTSQLFTNLREKEGLAYELGSFYTPEIYSGDLTAFIFAPPSYVDPQTKQRVDSLPQIKNQLLDQITQFAAAPPAAADLERAKHYVIGTYEIKHERVQDRAYLMGVAELCGGDGALYDLNYADYVNAVTAADVQRVAKQYFVHPAISTLQPNPDGDGTVSE
jgi:predicted Zn-dependent peptidase